MKMPKHIDEVEFTIFDTETTGLKPEDGDRIVELAGLRVKGSERIAVFDALINPSRPISPGAFAVNKITAQMLQDASCPKEVLGRFLEFIRGSCLCSYNAEFDLGFLNNELKLISLPAPLEVAPRPVRSGAPRRGTSNGARAAGLLTGPAVNNLVVFDLLTMARKLMPGLSRYALWFVAGKLGVNLAQEHRAFSDVEMAWEVFGKFKVICREKGITDFSDFSKLFAFNPKFGYNI